jgi:4-hydroxybutyryl-CoA dehydratase / vinylacetyl-CoA-Delta-isomerase
MERPLLAQSGHSPQTSPADLVMQNKMRRRLGQLTGTCFQRCVGMDVLNTLHSVTFDLDRKNGTRYLDRFKDFLARSP